jgi:hypothetical protein
MLAAKENPVGHVYRIVATAAGKDIIGSSEQVRGADDGIKPGVSPDLSGRTPGTVPKEQLSPRSGRWPLIKICVTAAIVRIVGRGQKQLIENLFSREFIGA